jgi:DNA adenine methylase
MPAFEKTDQALTPLLKWAGGKRWLTPVLEELWSASSATRLVEPFCGGLAVALALRPSHALLNDINPHLINFYTWVRSGFKLTIECANDEELYYQHRERFNQLIACGQSDSRESAELFYFLNRTGYNGLCRFNKSGLFNVPFGRYSTINYRTNFLDYQNELEPWEFDSGDFAELATTSADFIYADPPYDVEFTQYSAGGFDWDDQVRLADWLADHPGPVALSNQATRRIIKLYRDRGFDLTYLEAPRRINNTGDRTPAREILATKGL